MYSMLKHLSNVQDCFTNLSADSHYLICGRGGQKTGKTTQSHNVTHHMQKPSTFLKQMQKIKIHDA
jgi:hypothetical protein